MFCFLYRYSALKSVIVATICTFFDALNVPVFWPILVMYFFILFTITMKRQIKVSYSLGGCSIFEINNIGQTLYEVNI